MCAFYLSGSFFSSSARFLIQPVLVSFSFARLNSARRFFSSPLLLMHVEEKAFGSPIHAELERKRWWIFVEAKKVSRLFSHPSVTPRPTRIHISAMRATQKPKKKEKSIKKEEAEWKEMETHCNVLRPPAKQHVHT
jgi:hypothetical protein